MAVPTKTIWELDPHTLVKHEILNRYLNAWFAILGQSNKHVVYIDGFCGPGRYEGGEEGSPIIALKAALNHRKILEHKKIEFLFIDVDSRRITHLNSELKKIPIPPNFSVKTEINTFDERFRTLLNELEVKGAQSVPIFAFIDPFGFKGIPLELVERLLKNQKTEAFINLSVDAINRWLEHPDEQIPQHIIDAFGTDEVFDIVKKHGKRRESLRLLYQRQLERFAKFVRYFKMENSDKKTIYYLFFATNHPLGHVKMKEAFWKVDTSSGFKFSDATNPYQSVLFEMDETDKLVEILHQHYLHQKISVEKIKSYVEDETPFLETHMRKALKLLENEQKIRADSLKRDGEKRTKGTFPDEVIVTFQIPVSQERVSKPLLF